MKRCAVIIAAVVLAVVAALAGPASAQQPFFAGKTINLYAGMPVGGGVDDEMRLTGRHLAKFIPGRPTILPRNMPGAGAVVLGNYLTHSAVPDGLTLGMPTRSGFLLSNVVAQDGIKYSLADFSYIGGAGSNSVTLWLRRPAGVTSLAALRAAKKEIVIGGLAPRTQSALIPRVLAKYESWPFKVVHGYPGFNEVLIAIERGEVDGLITAGPVTRPDMVTSGLLIPILQSVDEIPGVPLIADVVIDPAEKALLGLLLAPSRIGLPLMGPPSMPADRLDVLRKSYARMTADKEFQAEAEKRGIAAGRALGGDELHRLVVDNLTGVPAPVVKEYLALMQ